MKKAALALLAAAAIGATAAAITWDNVVERLTAAHAPHRVASMAAQ